MLCNSPSLFGPKHQYIKIYNGDFIAIFGSDIFEKLITSDLKIPYKQILKGRIILKPGQTNYLLNHLGLGDNVTFIAMRATYDPKSKKESDNYIIWNYHNNFTTTYVFKELLVLTGNSTNRIPQIFLTNPNKNYPVNIDVMVAVIDDNNSFYINQINQTGFLFYDVEYTDIHTNIIGESIVIKDKNNPPKPLIFFSLNTIQSIQRSEKILIINDSNFGVVTIIFKTIFDAAQSHSLINYCINNTNVVIENLNPIADIIPPIIYFNQDFYNYNIDIINPINPNAQLPYNSTDSNEFEINGVDLNNFNNNEITKSDIINGLINYITDNRDGVINISASNINILNTLTNQYINVITSAGTYKITVNISDLAGNNLDNLNININVQ